MPPVTPAAPSPAAPKPAAQTAPVVRPWIPPQTQAEAKPPTRDPRLNRCGPSASPQPKEQSTGKKGDTHSTGGHAPTPEKSVRKDKTRTQRKEVPEEKPTSKSPSPMTKGAQSKHKQAEGEAPKSGDGPKKDPRLRKRTQDKMGEGKDEELKEKKRCSDRKERDESVRGGDSQRPGKGKLLNGSMTKHDHEESSEKVGGNARTHARKRTRSRSRSPTFSPKRKDRRSPKSRTRSSSLSPSPSHKPGKPRRAEPEHDKPGREDRLEPKKNQSDSRRSKRPADDRHDSHSSWGHEGGSKEAKDAPHRWRSGWEENKQ